MLTLELNSSTKKVREYIQKGQFKEAENLIDAVLNKWPDELEVLNLKGLVKFKTGAYLSAADAFTRYLSLRPKNVLVLNNLALCHQKTGKYKDAKTALEKAIKIDRVYVNSYLNLMSITFSEKDYDTTIRIFDETQKLELGLKCNIIAAAAYKAMGKIGEAKDLLKSYLVSHQSDLGALNNLGNIEREEGNLKEAGRIFESLLRQNPKFLEAKLNLAITLDALDEFKRSEKLLQDLSETDNNLVAEISLSQIYYRRGLHEAAVSRLMALLSRNKLEGEVHHEIGSHLYKLKDYKSAIEYLNKARTLGYETDQTWNIKALSEEALGNYQESVNLLRECLKENPNSNSALNNLGRIFVTLGDQRKGLEYIQKAYLQKPHRNTAYSNFLFNLHYNPDISVNQIYEHSLKVGKAISDSVTKKYTSWPCTEKSDLLTLAFYSPDFNKHPVGFLIESVLRELKKTPVRLVAISGSTKKDEQTEVLRGLFDHWITTKGLNTEAVAKKVYTEQPHALIDLAGYTDGGLMELFAYKSAPIQIEWLGYLSTSGLPEMDFFFADETTAKDTHQFFCEEVVCLDCCHLNYYIPEYDLSTGEPPALNNGHITFGSFNNIAKINDSVLDVWSEILLKTENAIIRLQAKNTDKSFVQNKLFNRFKNRGISKSRVLIVPPVGGRNYLQSYRDVDICLDTFPYTGGKITLDTIFMGVPLVTLNGESHFSRNTASILNTINHSELIARNHNEYAEIALELSADIDKLVSYRKNLRKSYLAEFRQNPAKIADGLIDTITRQIELIKRGQGIS